jgi:TonB-linked SusC/RagA family outer membrane protein
MTPAAARRCGLGLLIGCALTGSVAAQTRAITGTVIDSLTSAPLAGATLEVHGLQAARSREDGSFLLADVPDTSLTLFVHLIGYTWRGVVLPAGTAHLAIRLARDPFRLDELVVSGNATSIERRNLAHAVGIVTSEDLWGTPTASLEDQLQGLVAGADIQRNSGAPGGGVQVRLRGTTSINSLAGPLYVVDGVIVSDAIIPSHASEITLGEDDAVNRIADLNPDDIATIEILKGASSGAIFGSKASSGVVLITTKRGGIGRPRVSFRQRIGFSEASHRLGFRVFRSAEEVEAAYPGMGEQFRPGAVFDNEGALTGRRPLAFETAAALSGGSEQTRYYASGQVQHEPGIIANTGFRRHSVRLNLEQRLGRRVSVQLSTNVLHTLAQRGLTNNDNSGGTSFYVALPFTPSFVDLTQRPDGSWPLNPLAASNPLQTAALLRNDERVGRFLGAGRLSSDLIVGRRSSLRLVGGGGVDYFNQDNSLLFPPELQFQVASTAPGATLKANSDNLSLNLDANLVHTYSTVADRLVLTTSAGVQYERVTQDVSRATVRNLIPGTTDAGARTSSETRSKTRDLGFFLQEEVLTFNRRMVLTGGLRADQSSLNGDPDRLYLYPKASAALRLLQPAAFLTELKLRVAYGESGNLPVYGQKFIPLDGTVSADGIPGLIPVGTVGAFDLRPERQREFEAGFDAELPRQAATIEFTGFQKWISDLLLRRTLAGSTGFATEIRNGGSLRTCGVEASVGLSPVRTRSVEWLARLTFAATRSKVTELPVPAFFAGTFGLPFGSFRIEEGKSPTQIVGGDTLPDGRDTVRALGDANPDFKLALRSDLRYRRLTLSFLLDWQQGGDIINFTRFLYDVGQTTADFAEPIAGSSLTRGQQRLQASQRLGTAYLESGTFLKLREIRLTWQLPEAALGSLWGGVRSAEVSLGARNLFTATGYSGLDPEVNDLGNQPVARNFDIAPFPPSRSFWLGVGLGF